MHVLIVMIYTTFKQVEECCNLDCKKILVSDLYNSFLGFISILKSQKILEPET